jgi:DNA polymerase-3 subunit epsilon
VYRQSTILKMQEIWASQPVFLDTETTGLYNAAEVIEIAIVDQDGSLLLETLVRPRRPVPMDAVRVHGITDEMLLTAPTWLNVWPRVEAVLSNRSVGVYNAEFDLRMMQQTHQSSGMPWRPPAFRLFDIMQLYADFSGAYRWLKLEDVGRQCGIALPNSHRARDDSMLAREVFMYMIGSTSSFKTQKPHDNDQFN